jgi:hypothetical protein
MRSIRLIAAGLVATFALVAAADAAQPTNTARHRRKPAPRHTTAPPTTAPNNTAPPTNTARHAKARVHRKRVVKKRVVVHKRRVNPTTKPR